VKSGKRSLGVIPIRHSFLSEADELVADLAYTLWRSAPFRCGPPEEALWTALRMVKGKSAVGLFLVPKRKHGRHPIIAMKSRPSGG
jgi:hypothetical protein